MAAVPKDLWNLVSSVRHSHSPPFKLIHAKLRVVGNLGRPAWPAQGSPLHEAVRCRSEVKVRLLVEAGVNVSCHTIYNRGHHRFTALHLAVSRDSVDMVRLLLELGADITAEGARYGVQGTPLQWAMVTSVPPVAQIIDLLEGRRAGQQQAGAEDALQGHPPLQLDPEAAAIEVPPPQGNPPAAAAAAATAPQVAAAVLQIPATPPLPAGNRPRAIVFSIQTGNHPPAAASQEETAPQQLPVAVPHVATTTTASLYAPTRAQEGRQPLAVVPQMAIAPPAAAQATSSGEQVPPGAASKQIKLDLALQIHDRIKEKNAEIQTMEDQKKRLDQKARQVEEEREMLEIGARRLQEDISALKDQPDYKNEKQIERLIAQLQSEQPRRVVEDSNCPVCFETPWQIFNCVECENWVCVICKERLLVCPICRNDFSAHPPRRNRTAERLLGL